jgi:hypothetical protein
MRFAPANVLSFEISVPLAAMFMPCRNRPRRDAKAVSDTHVGIFLGFSTTMKKVIYFDIESENVKEAQHVRFDEGMNDLLEKPPNARLLDGIRTKDQMCRITTKALYCNSINCYYSYSSYSSYSSYCYYCKN